MKCQTLFSGQIRKFFSQLVVCSKNSQQPKSQQSDSNNLPASMYIHCLHNKMPVAFFFFFFFFFFFQDMANICKL